MRWKFLARCAYLVFAYTRSMPSLIIHSSSDVNLVVQLNRVKESNENEGSKRYSSLILTASFTRSITSCTNHQLSFSFFSLSFLSYLVFLLFCVLLTLGTIHGLRRLRNRWNSNWMRGYHPPRHLFRTYCSLLTHHTIISNLRISRDNMNPSEAISFVRLI